MNTTPGNNKKISISAYWQKKLLFLLTGLLISLSISGQDKISELITDRPDQTESAAVVPLGTLQIETGFIMKKDETEIVSERLFTYNTTLLRYGILKRLELRLGLELLSERIEFKNSDIKEHITGFGPLVFQFKFRIAQESGWIPDIALIGGAAFPFSAKEYFRTTNPAPSLRFAFSHSLTDRMSLGTNLGTEWNGESSSPGLYYSIALNISGTDRLGLFTEFFGFMREPGSRMHLFDAGFTYLVVHNLQLDLSGGIGLNNTAFDSFISFGLSYRLPH